MHAYGYTLHVPLADQPPILAQLRSIICETLNLCASVGCGCVTGDGADTLCHETEAGHSFPLHHSEGPGWAIYIITADDRIRFDIYLTLPFINMEQRALYERLVAFDRPLFPHSLQGHA